jgi:hypothetical protein
MCWFDVGATNVAPAASLDNVSRGVWPMQAEVACVVEVCVQRASDGLTPAE